MRRRRCHGVAAVAAGALLLLASWSIGPRWVHAQTAPVADQRCDGADVHVRATNLEEARLACDGARRALAFLARYGLAADRPIELALQPRLPPQMHGSAVGCYDRRSHAVTVLTYAEFLERGSWFGVPIDRELHRSAVAHEVAHAIVGCQPGAARLSLAAHEYLAYVAMFGTMEPPLRERVLANYPGAGFERESHINALIHAFDPMHFGASAWQHFRRLADGRAYVQRVLAGEILHDEATLGN